MSARPQPWHAEALRLRAQDPPATYEQIAGAVGVSHTTVARFLSPAYGERQRAGNRRWMRDVGNARQQERYRTDPAFRRSRLKATRKYEARRKRERQDHHP